MSKEKRISYWDETGKYQKEYDRLWKAHVPKSGECETTEGELIRAIGRLFYEYCNNGNCNAGEVIEESCSVCGGSGYEEEDCHHCGGCGVETDDEGNEGTCEYCSGSGVIMEDCSWCGGHCTEQTGLELNEFYKNFLDHIENEVGCYKEVAAVKSLITDTNLNYNYKYTQEEMNIYNALCDKVIEHVLEKEQEGVNLICKDNIEKILIDSWASIGIDIPDNFEEVVQWVFEDVMDSSDYPNYNNSDVMIGFRRWIEAQRKYHD